MRQSTIVDTNNIIHVITALPCEMANGTSYHCMMSTLQSAPWPPHCLTIHLITSVLCTVDLQDLVEALGRHILVSLCIDFSRITFDRLVRP